MIETTNSLNWNVIDENNRNNDDTKWRWVQRFPWVYLLHKPNKKKPEAELTFYLNIKSDSAECWTKQEKNAIHKYLY